MPNRQIQIIAMRDVLFPTRQITVKICVDSVTVSLVRAKFSKCSFVLFLSDSRPVWLMWLTKALFLPDLTSETFQSRRQWSINHGRLPKRHGNCSKDVQVMLQQLINNVHVFVAQLHIISSWVFECCRFQNRQSHSCALRNPFISAISMMKLWAIAQRKHGK